MKNKSVDLYNAKRYWEEETSPELLASRDRVDSLLSEPLPGWKKRGLLIRNLLVQCSLFEDTLRNLVGTIDCQILQGPSLIAIASRGTGNRPAILQGKAQCRINSWLSFSQNFEREHPDRYLDPDRFTQPEAEWAALKPFLSDYNSYFVPIYNSLDLFFDELTVQGSRQTGDASTPVPTQGTSTGG